MRKLEVQSYDFIHIGINSDKDLALVFRKAFQPVRSSPEHLPINTWLKLPMRTHIAKQEMGN
jgi:hypothetical protein